MGVSSGRSGDVYELLPINNNTNSSSLKYIDESIYEILSNANSGTAPVVVEQPVHPKNSIIEIKNCDKQQASSRPPSTKIDVVKKVLMMNSEKESKNLVPSMRDQDTNTKKSLLANKKSSSELADAKINVKSRIDMYKKFTLILFF